MDKRNNETKNNLVEAYRLLFEKQGADKISVLSLCAKAGITRNTFYYHFKDLRDLINYLFDEDSKTILASVTGKSEKETINAAIDYLFENRRLLSSIYQNYGCMPLDEAFAPNFNIALGAYLDEKEKEIGCSLPYKEHLFAVRFLAEAIGGLLMSIVKGGALFTKEELEEYISLALERFDLRSYASK